MGILDLFRLDGEVAVVTGGGTGIGNPRNTMTMKIGNMT